MNKRQRISLAIWTFARIAGSEATCKFCGDSPIPTDGLLREKNGLSCRTLFQELTNVQEGTNQCNQIQLAAFHTGCCNDQYVPKNVCSVCPNNSTNYRSSITIPGSTERKALTCGAISSEASFLDFFNTPGDCSDTFLQRSAAWCQCPGYDIKCHLCPKGSVPTDLKKTENVLYGWSCENFQYILSLLTTGECHVASQILEFDAAAFCCNGVEPPNVCDLCPAGQEILNPHKQVSTKYGTVKCGDIEESLRMVPTTESCAYAKKSFHSDMCCGVPGSSATSPTSGLGSGLSLVLLASMYALI